MPKIFTSPNAFREAAEGPTQRHVAQTLFQTVHMWLLFLGALPWAIVRTEGLLGIPGFSAKLGLGIGLFVAASAVALYSGVLMAVHGQGTPLPTACARRLVVIGPYRYVRNPMAITGLVQAAAVGIGIGSWSVLAYVLTGFLVWTYAVRPLEEADLAKRFGDSFARYCAEVRCWIPRLRPYRPD